MTLLRPMQRWALEYGVYVLLALVSIAVESTWLASIHVWGAPALGLSAVVVTAVALGWGAGHGARCGFIVGLLTDLFAGRYIGLGASALAISGLAVGLIARRVYVDASLIWVAAAFGAGLAHKLIYLLGAAAVGAPLQLVLIALQHTLPETICNSFFALPAYWALTRVRRRRRLEAVGS